MTFWIAAAIPWLAAGALLLGGWVLFSVHRNRKWMQAIEAELSQLPPVADEEAGPPDLECVIRLHDPLRVAEQESRLARTLTGVAPRLVSREVYRQVCDETVKLLGKRAIEADVQVRAR